MANSDPSKQLYEKTMEIWKHHGFDPNSGGTHLSETEKSEVACWVSIEELREEYFPKFISFFEENRKFPIDCHAYMSIYTRMNPNMCFIVKHHGVMMGI